MLLPLGAAPVLGVSLTNITLLRLDQMGGLAPGNKRFKLQGYLEEAARRGVRRLVSFGGAWSNHLHALAALGAEQGWETVGIVRGERGDDDTAMLADARRWGMHIVPVSRQQYRQRNNPDWQRELRARFAPCLLIPEGGASQSGVSGCLELANMIRRLQHPARSIVVPVGTGATLAGLAAGLDANYQVLGISALKGAVDLDQNVQALCAQCETPSRADWRIFHEFHCGGFARTTPALRQFMQAFEAIHPVRLDPVYTGKMLFALWQLQQQGRLVPEQPLLAVHTGGVQGRRGYAWLA